MKIIDLFSGIGGFSLGFQRAGYQFTEHYFSEIDKSAIANYKKTFQMQNTSEILPLFTEETLQELTLSLSDRLVKISALLEEERGLKETKVALSKKQLPSLLTSDQIFLSGKMLKEHSPQMLVKTFGQFSKHLPTLGIIQSSDILQDEVPSQEAGILEAYIPI